MLTDLIRLLEEDPGNMSLVELSRTLEVHPSVVSGMLRLLIAKGRLQEMDPVCGECETCWLNNGCDLSAERAKIYALRNRNHRNPTRSLPKES